MIPPLDELATLQRIVMSVKAYRHQTGDKQNLTRNESLDVFLKQQLSGHEWQFWQPNKAYR